MVVSVFTFGINTNSNQTIIDTVKDIDYTLWVWDTACGLKVYVHSQCNDDGGRGT